MHWCCDLTFLCVFLLCCAGMLVWHRPTGECWRDIIVNVRFNRDQTGHIAEIQLGYSPLLVGTRGSGPSESGQSALQQTLRQPAGSRLSEQDESLPEHPVIVTHLENNRKLSFDWLNLRVGPYGWLRSAREQVGADWLEWIRCKYSMLTSKFEYP